MSRLHLASAFLGFGIASVCALTMSLVSPPPLPAPPRSEFVPHPRDMVQIREGTPFTVPPDRIFVATGIGGSHGTGVELRVDGIARLQSYTTTGPSVCAVPLGLKVPAGSVVTVVTSQGNLGEAWGFTTGL